MSYALKPFHHPLAIPDDRYAAEMAVTTCGDTVGIVKMTIDGKFELWHAGECLGQFSTMGMMCRALDRVEA